MRQNRKVIFALADHQLPDYNTFPNGGPGVSPNALPQDDDTRMTRKLWKRKQKLPTKKIYQLGIDIPTTDESDTTR